MFEKNTLTKFFQKPQNTNKAFFEKTFMNHNEREIAKVENSFRIISS